MGNRTVYFDKETDAIIDGMPKGALSQVCQAAVFTWDDGVKTDLELQKKLLRLEETKKKIKEQEEQIQKEMEFEIKKRKDFEKLDRVEGDPKQIMSDIRSEIYFKVMSEIYGEFNEEEEEENDPDCIKTIKLNDKFESKYEFQTKEDFKKDYNNIKPEARGFLIEELGEKQEGKGRMDLINEWFKKNSEKEVSNGD